MGFKHLFFPEVKSFPDSKINKNIKLLRYVTGDTLIVDGLIESGSIMSHIWRVGVKKLLPINYHPRSVLLLGLAGGSNAKLINDLFPLAEITAVEIDKTMIEIGFKYFSLAKRKNMQIVTRDALDFVNEIKDEHYDLVLVDCFVGQEIPQKLESLDFFKKLKNHSDFTLINRLWHPKYRHASQKFIDSLASQFKFVSIFTGTNLVISLI